MSQFRLHKQPGLLRQLCVLLSLEHSRVHQLAGRVRNLFRLQCAMGEASIVVVWAPNESEILSANVVRLVLWFRRLKVCQAVCSPEVNQGCTPCSLTLLNCKTLVCRTGCPPPT